MFCKKVSRLSTLTVVTLTLFSVAITPARAAGQKIVPGHVPAAVAHLVSIGDLPATNRLRLVVGLPLHNQAALDQLLVDLNDPASANYHQWLTADQFSQRFGPTDEDYRKVVDYVQRRGLTVTGLCSNRMLVDVEASVPDIEQALQVKLRLYPHPTENRDFYAPDTDPTIDTNVPILHISGLDNFTLPHRLGGFKWVSLATNNGVTPYYTGSAPGGYFMGKDFRAAYVPGVTNTGAGQYIAVADVGGLYYSNDIYDYETNAGLSTNTVITNIVATQTAYWTNALTGSSTDDGEEALDICMSMSMAPGATIMNYEGGSDDVFNRIASDNLAKQITLSYGFGIDVTTIQSFQQFLAQGQALSQASGDGDADLNGGTGLTGNPYATIVGGTTLTTSSAGGPWSSEASWNWGGNTGSGGGISGYGIPNWQLGVGTATNQGSAFYRNYPDVAMPGDGVFLISKNGTSVGWVGGTSCASPLWAGFMALANQQAASLGKPAIGFPNPAIYALGKGPYAAYTNCFHDIVTGNNVNSQNPTRFYATNGYDLCTGWGTPRGSNTITALAGIGTNDFIFYTSQGALSVVRGGVATTTITVARMNQFAGTINFSVSGLPNGVTTVLSPTSTTSSSLLTLTVGSSATAGTYPITITGTSGALTHVASLSLTVVTPVPGTTQVSLSSFYNRPGIWTDGNSFSGGLDGGGYAYSANLLGTVPSWNGIAFALGPVNASDAVSCSGQTITLPAGRFNSLQLLATAVDGSQSAQNFTVTYTDNSTSTFTQSLSDWASPQHYPGESVVVSMAYRNNGGGSKDLYTTVNLYNYNFTLNQTKTVKSLTLPNNGDVVLLALALANDSVTAPLATYYNLPGMYSDGVTFTNPATGGMDGEGNAYSATLLTGSETWSNNLFSFGPANVTNVISATNQTITLPAGNYWALQMLATGIQGDQTSQTFTAKYTDGTTSAFSQSLSDWYTPQSYAGESKAVIMGHRNTSNGTADERTFNLYGYSLKLNSAKVLQSITLPNAPNVIVTAISLVPDWPPTFNLNPFSLTNANASHIYSGSVATNATDLNGDTITFAKVSGPAWLTVAANGAVSGIPSNANANTNTFVISATDPGGLSNTATLNIYVNGAPSFTVNPFTLPVVEVGQSYSGTIATNASDPNPGDTLAFALVSGPSWLNVAANGTLSGTPSSADLNTNTFVVSVTDPDGLSNTATLYIYVDGPPSFVVNPFTQPVAEAGQNYSGTIATNATDPNTGYALTFGLVSGPAWLNLAANGALSGIPSNANANNNTFVVSVTDANGFSNTATLYIYVNGAPSFTINPFTLPTIVAGQNYSGTIATNATDPNPGDVLTFARVSGPAWLTVGSGGTLSGMPLSANVGTDSFLVSVTDSGGLSNTATLDIAVTAPPAIIATLATQPGGLLLNWSGGIAPYQVQSADNLLLGDWQNLGGATTNTSLSITPTNCVMLYRISGQ